MLQRAKNIQLIGDPLTLPPQSNEIEFLVRFFYKLSQIINIKVSGTPRLFSIRAPGAPMRSDRFHCDFF